MTNDLAATRDRLVREWEAIPDFPAAEDVARQCERSCKFVALIHWIDTHPTATRQEYRAELARVQQTQIDTPRFVEGDAEIRGEDE